jgi:MFS family permease
VEALEAAKGRGVFAVRDFRRLWLIGLLVSVARWLEMLVIAVVVFQASGSASLVAVMTLLRIAPMGLFGAFLAVVADRVPRRSALIGVLALQVCAVAALAALDAAGGLALWQVALASLVGGIGWATDNPIRRMLVGEAVGAARIGTAISLDFVANNASRVAGPVLGGTLLAVFGPAAAFGVCALFYLAAIAAALGTRLGAAAERTREAGMLAEIRGSFALALHEKRLRAVLVVTMVFNVFAWPCTSMIPVIGQASLGLGPEGVGVLASMDGLGALLGAVLISRWALPVRHAAIYVVGTAVHLAALICFAVAPSAILAGALLVLMGVGGAGFATMQATLIYLSAPPTHRGRAFGMLSTATGTGLLGFLQLGLLADWLGAPIATAVIAGQGLLVLLATWCVWNPIFRDD